MVSKFRGILLVFLAVLLVCSVKSNTVHALVRVDPSRFIITWAEGDRLTETIQVTNRGEESVELIANVYDWTIAQDSDEILDYPPGTLPETLDGWIRFNPRSFKLEPGETQLVRFTIAAPEGESLEFEHRGVVFFEHTGYVQQEGMGARVISMIGSTVYVIPEQFEMSFGLLDAVVRQTEDGYFMAHMAVGNNGPVHVRYTVSYRVLDADHAIIDEHLYPKELILLPGFVRTPAFVLNGEYPPGSYQLAIRLHIDRVAEPLTHVVEFQVTDG